MEFEWDERKRAQIIKERARFRGRRSIFDGRATSHQPTPRIGEERWKTTAIVDGIHLTLVWCWRDEKNPRDYKETSA